MLSLTKPSDKTCESVLSSAGSGGLNFSHPGCLKGATPKGFNRDFLGCSLGSGELVWEAAVDSFGTWCFMPAKMVEVKNAGAIEVNRVVGVLLRALGVWSLNPARITEIHDSTSGSGSTIFGFTYATLMGHVEAGEERFLLTWDRETNEVRYEIEAVSRPFHVLAWLAYPYSRMMQAKFREASCAAVLAAVESKLRS